MRQFIYVKDPLAVSIRSNPLSKSMSIAQSLVSIIESPGLPYDIPCSGVFFSQLPQRLVSCPTLAIATSAMVKTHQSLHNHNETLYRQALSHHGTALRAVRNMLQDPSQAYSVNTACAIYLIMACQELLWGPAVPATQHMAMLLAILRNAFMEGWLQEFHISMLVCYLPTITFEMAYNPDLKPEPWFYELIAWCAGNRNGQMTVCDSIAMMAFAQMPRFNSNPHKYYTQISQAYRLLKDELEKLSVKESGQTEPTVSSTKYGEGAQGLPPEDPIQVPQRDMQTLGPYTTMLAAGALLNRLLRQVEGCTELLMSEMKSFCNEIVSASQQGFKFGPLAAGVMPQTMAIVWAASEPCPERNSIKEAGLGSLNYEIGVKWLERARRFKSAIDNRSVWKDVDRRSYQFAEKS